MIDTGSATWASIRAWADDEIASAFAALCVQGLSQPETEYHRGRIAALRALLRRGEPPVVSADGASPLY